MTGRPQRFGFGRNWEKFVEWHFSEERVEIARRHLLGFLRRDDLANLSFIDIGCGSGLHSLAAFRAGAERIHSFDYDPAAVRITEKLREKAGRPSHWLVREGSILDEDFIGRIAPGDIVYAWGVLHHTGDMWRGMDHSFKLLNRSSLFYVALYDYEIHVNPSPEFWLDVKKRYNESGRLGKRGMELWYIWRFMLGKNPCNIPSLVKRIVAYKASRGMAFYTDVVDWLGGWPMDFAKREDVKAWATRKGLEIITIKTGEANTEWLFRRP